MDYVIEVNDREKELLEKAAEPYGGDIGALLGAIIDRDAKTLSTI